MSTTVVAVATVLIGTGVWACNWMIQKVAESAATFKFTHPEGEFYAKEALRQRREAEEKQPLSK